MDVINRILSGDIDMVVKGQQMLYELYQKYGPSVSIYDALVAEGYILGEEPVPEPVPDPIAELEQRAQAIPDYLFSLTDDFNFSPNVYDGFESPSYEINSDGSWFFTRNPFGVGDGFAGDVKDALFQQLGVTTLKALSGKFLGGFGGTVGQFIDQASDALNVKKFVASMLEQKIRHISDGFDGVSRDSMTFSEYDSRTTYEFNQVNSGAREYITGKLGGIGGTIMEIFNKNIFGMSEVNSFKVVLFDSNTMAVGGAKRDSFIGSDGDEHFMVTGGGDIILALEGDDTFHINNAYGGARLAGGEGFDQIIVSGASADFDVVTTQDGFDVYGDDGVVETIGMERLEFSDGTLAFDLNGNAGQGYRIYQAAFDRQPDTSGLSYWVDQLDAGMTLYNVALSFIGSDEFRMLYGSNPSNEDFVELLYQNVLNRNPDTGGYDYWTVQMDEGLTRADMLIAFSESLENKANVSTAIEDGIWLI